VAPVITVFVKYKDKILLLKRSDKVSTYKGKWNTVAGYLDELRPVEEKIFEELKEEIGVEKDNISSIILSDPFEFKDERIAKEWIVTPALVELRRPEIKLNWEHTEYKWITPREIRNFETVPNLDQSLKKVLR
jgi:NADH pyrophosphatase NudC (nudix superfamily)